MDRGAWWATVHGVTKLTRPSEHNYLNEYILHIFSSLGCWVPYRLWEKSSWRTLAALEYYRNLIILLTYLFLNLKWMDGRGKYIVPPVLTNATDTLSLTTTCQWMWTGLRFHQSGGFDFFFFFNSAVILCIGCRRPQLCLPWTSWKHRFISLMT